MSPDRIADVDVCVVGSGSAGSSAAIAAARSGASVLLRSLVVRDSTKVLVAGRCLSATHEAYASVRSMAQCMAMGQAAGTTAALSIETGRSPRNVAIGELQARLRAAGAILDRQAAVT